MSINTRVDAGENKRYPRHLFRNKTSELSKLKKDNTELNETNERLDNNISGKHNKMSIKYNINTILFCMDLIIV